MPPDRLFLDSNSICEVPFSLAVNIPLMILRKMIRLFALISLTAMFFGCRKSTAVSVVQPALHVTPTDAIIRIHWLGKKKIVADTNAAGLMKIWNLPESVKLEAQTLDKLSAAPWRLFRGETNQSSTNLLRPLMEDIAQEESYIEIRRATNSPNFADEMVLAIRLNDQRAGLWQTNLAAALESLTGIRPTNSQPGARWSLKKHEAPNLIEFTRAGEWMVVGAAQEHNALLDETLARISGVDASFPSSTTNSWLEASGDLSRIASAIGVDPGFGLNLPKFSLAVLGDGENVLTRGELTLLAPAPVQLESWNIPTNLIDGDLNSFTAVRGLKPWLASAKFWTNLQVGPPPDQLCAWARRGFPMQTYFAAPLPDASNEVSRLSDLVLRLGRPWFATNGLVAFQKSKNFNGLSWRGLPYVDPFLRSIGTNSGGFVFGGGLPEEGAVLPPPSELLKEVLDRTNLVYKDWELTGKRISQCIYLAQFVRVASGKAQLPHSAFGLEWLTACVSQLGDTTTEITQNGPTQLSFTRKSGVGFTAVELNLIADWLESPEFPHGTYSLVAPLPGQAISAPKTP